MQGITLKSQIPLRAERNHRSEMVSQLLFGETYAILDRVDDWLLIKTNYDSYIGWISADSFEEFTKQQEIIIVCDKSIEVTDDKGSKITIPAGAEIPQPNNENIFTINDKIYKISSDISIKPKGVIESAKQFLTAPYLWGGKTFMGFDCSGFVQVIYKMNNMVLPRDASEQIKFGNAIPIIQEAKEGNLVFFGDEENITHVGILLSTEQVIHCSGEVKIDFIDNTGIFNGKKYTHFLRGIKSY